MNSDSDRFVTVVSGLPRSGTSMMMRMLEAGGLPVMTDRLREADDDNPRGYYEFEPVKKTKEDSSWLDQAPGKVVKMVYRLLYDLPDGYVYRVLFMRRRMEEVLASQKKMLERKGEPGDAVSDEQMARMFRKQLDEFHSWIRQQPRFHVVEIDYNEMLENPAHQVDRINAFLGGQLDTESMCRVVEPALYRNRV